ncbi:MAG: hypothetical protein IKK58_06925 [Clostridia bacterium]|nr:hypothetical protein [Clostridia bacterium]
MEDRFIKCNVKQSVLVCIIGVILVGICAFFVFVDFRELAAIKIFDDPIIYYFVKIFMALAGVFLAVGTACIAINAIINKDKVIELRSDHFVDRSSVVAAGKIYYSQISSVYIQGMFLCIKLKDERQYYKKSNLFKRLFMALNKELKYEYITIGDQFLQSNIYDLKKMITDRMAAENAEK